MKTLKSERLRRQQREAEAAWTDARVKAILRRDITGSVFSTLRHEAGTPSRKPRQARDNPYRLAPLMAEEIHQEREIPADYPMASRGESDQSPLVKAIEQYGRASAWVTLASYGLILLAILLASLHLLEIWP